MPSTIHAAVFSIALLFSLTAIRSAEADDALSVRADAPLIPLTERASGRQQVQLPTLEYLFEIQVRCRAGWLPDALMLSVADTRKSLAASEIVENGLTEIRMRIPSGQLPPLYVEDFCVANNNGDSRRSDNDSLRLTIPGALSVQVSLSCLNDENSNVTYVSRPLDVSLVCERTSAEDDPEGPLIDAH